MKAFKISDECVLESMIDEFGLHTIVDALATICFEKAEHLRSNWQDENMARNWDLQGKQFHKVKVFV